MSKFEDKIRLELWGRNDYRIRLVAVSDFLILTTGRDKARMMGRFMANVFLVTG